MKNRINTCGLIHCTFDHNFTATHALGRHHRPKAMLIWETTHQTPCKATHKATLWNTKQIKHTPEAHRQTQTATPHVIKTVQHRNRVFQNPTPCNQRNSKEGRARSQSAVLVLTRLPLLAGPTDGERFSGRRGRERQRQRGVHVREAVEQSWEQFNGPREKTRRW